MLSKTHRWVNVFSVARRDAQPNKIMKTATNLDLLNKVQQFIIDQSNASGVNLADEFASVQEFKNFVIGFAFKGLRDAGMEVEDAFDAALGDGSYDKLAAETFAKFTA